MEAEYSDYQSDADFHWRLLVTCSRVQPLDSLHAETEATHRVVVAYPEQWAFGEYRNCYLGSIDVVHNLPSLDCDIHAHETPRSRMFVMDVKFSGKYNFPPTTDSEQQWTCERAKETLTCRR